MYNKKTLKSSVLNLLQHPRPLSSIECDDIMRLANVNNYLGADFARDNIPKKLLKGQSLIINLDKESGNGSHWLAVYCGDEYTLYFDSFGIIPCPEIIKLMKSAKQPMIYATDELQSVDSIMCGYYACLWIIKINRGVSFLDVFDKFRVSNEKSNDKKLITELKKLIL
jgi:hypothetical protein